MYPSKHAHTHHDRNKKSKCVWGKPFLFFRTTKTYKMFQYYYFYCKQAFKERKYNMKDSLRFKQVKKQDRSLMFLNDVENAQHLFYFL